MRDSLRRNHHGAELDKSLKPIELTGVLGDDETVHKAVEAVAAEDRVKK